MSAKTQTPYHALEKFKAYDETLSEKVSFNSHFDLVKTVYSEKTPLFYVYADKNDDNGFVILSADDDKELLVGYGSSGSLDTAQIPETLNFLIANSSRNSLPAHVKEAKAIAPILTSKWSQDAPYNNILPTLSGTACKVGCVGTAISQLIRHYRYPESPIGVASYYWTGGMANYSLDLSEYTFDFDNMIDDYKDGNPSDVQIKAMNDLTYCCAAAVNSDWGTSVTTAVSKYIPEKMVNHFNYSKDCGKIDSKYLTIAEWSNILYSQLEKGLPVLISANKIDSSIGHEFICDGYDGNGYFHINWGWGGNFDGFYNIASLYTYDPDVDFSSEGFAKNQTAVINLYPESMEVSPDVVCTAENFRLSDISSESIRIICYYRNLSCDQSVKYGMRLTEVNHGNSQYIDKGDSNFIDQYGWKQYLPDNLPDGTYQVTPAIYICETGIWQDIYTTIDSRKCYINVEGGQVSKLDTSDELKDLVVANPTFPEAVFSKMRFCASAELTNPNDRDVMAGIKVGICSIREDGTYKPLTTNESTLTSVKLSAGETRTIDLTYLDEFYHYDQERYLCFLQCSNSKWTVIGEPVKMPITEYVPGTLILDDVTIDRVPTESNPTLTLIPVFHCEDGYYNGEVVMRLIECDENGEILESQDSPILASRIDVYGGNMDSNDDFSKLPKSPIKTYGYNPTPTKISGNMPSGTKVGPTGSGNSSGSSGSDGSNGSDPDKYCKPVFGYGSHDDDYIWIVSGLLLSIYYLEHWLDTPQLPDNLSSDKQIYYDLSGKALQQQPSAPGIYIKANQNANVKAEKIIIH